MAQSAESDETYWNRPDRLVRFVPKRRDDVKPEAVAWIDGDPFVVGFAGTMDEGPYDGETMWAPMRDQPGPRVGWIPDCDLVDVTYRDAVEALEPTWTSWQGDVPPVVSEGGA